MDTTSATRILVIDPDRAEATQISSALTAPDLYCRFITDPARVLGGVKQLRPSLLLMRAEVRSSTVNGVLEALASDPTVCAIPLVLLAADLSDRDFVEGLRTGLVELIPLPFQPTRHPTELRALLEALPRRRGVCSGVGDSRRLTALIEHLRRTRRDGTLRVSQLAEGEGRANFVRGVPQSASYGARTGIEALVAMAAQPKGAWSFTEVSAEGGGVVIELSDAELAHEDADEEHGPISGELEVPIELEESPAAGGSVLLVDDDPTLCKMFGALFTKHGFTVTSAADGLEGCERAAAGRYDLVIADLNMPRMDGWGMLRLLRDDFRTRELPVAFLSCHDDYRDSLRALDAGAQAYFSKSIRLDTLVGQAKDLLRPRQLLRRQLARDAEVKLDVGSVGPQWLVRTLAEQRQSGKVSAKDGFASYELFIADGRPVHATATAGRYTATGERAFNAFVASKGALGTFRTGTFPSLQTLSLSAEEQLAKSTATLNDNERHAREHQMVTADRIQVNPDLYAVYAHVGPKQWLEAARLICEEKLTPKDILSRLDASPVELEEMLRDLVRRGVVTLGA